MEKYSLGVQDFSRLRGEGRIYVDKTEQIHELTQLTCVFLSHPRRFGKSLLISTLKCLFEGRKELFEGLWIEDKVDWTELKHPILHFTFIESSFHTIGLERYLHIKIDQQAEDHGITLEHIDISNKIRELIEKLYAKHGKGVVFMVDEYDKPINEFLSKDKIETAKLNRDLMRQFYSPLKDLDRCLRFVFLTGVSKFSKVSIFSDLNHLEDITVGRRFPTLLGYTEAEIEHHFHKKIQQTADEHELTYEACFEKMRLWYNGYSWNKGKDKVYNPTSILKFLSEMDFRNFWFETGTPTFLTKMMHTNFTFDIDGIEVSEKRLGSYELENLDEIALLFQTGYLTIKGQEDDVYILGYPNSEVRDSMYNYLLAEFAYQHDMKPIARHIAQALGKRDFKYLFQLFNSLFGNIPYQIFDDKQERYYHAIIFLTFHLLGYYVQAEPSISQGRLDAVVETQDAIFIFEFKVNGTIADAFTQIHQNRYYQRYESTQKEIYLLAVVCKDKSLAEWEIQTLER